MEGIIVLVYVVVAGFSIALFVKTWIMTDDVRKIRDTLISPINDNFLFEISKMILFGNKERAKELLIEDFLKKIKTLNYADQLAEHHRKSIDKKFDKAKKALENDFIKVGIELPEEIKNLKSGNDFFDLF